MYGLMACKWIWGKEEETESYKKKYEWDAVGPIVNDMKQAILLNCFIELRSMCCSLLKEANAILLKYEWNDVYCEDEEMESSLLLKV